MGVVIPYETLATRRTIAREGGTREEAIAGELALMAAQREGRDRRDILAAARPLLELCRDRYGFTVMRPDLPLAPEALACALLTLVRGLRPLDEELVGRRPFWPYGVYFSDQRPLTWFEDGYGSMSGLAVPIGIDAAELTRFIEQWLKALRR
jgi:hypothetical protein